MNDVNPATSVAYNTCTNCNIASESGSIVVNLQVVDGYREINSTTKNNLLRFTIKCDCWEGHSWVLGMLCAGCRGNKDLLQKPWRETKLEGSKVESCL